MNYKVKMIGGEEFLVPQLVGDRILKAEADRINWNNRMINLRSISRLEPVNEKPYKELPEFKKPEMTQSRRIRQLESMIRGFKKTNDGKTGNGRVILERMNKSLELSKQGEKIEVQPSKMFGY